jgi:hypothetical protein
MENLELYEKFRKVPEEAKKPIKGGRLNGYTDINPMWRIKMLTEQFGICGIGWYYNTLQQWTVDHGEETTAFVNIELFVKVGGEWSKPIFGTGGSMLATKERAGIYVDDDCFKKATTDAISVACKQLGIGADVYWAKDSTKYTQFESDQTTEQPEQEQPKHKQNVQGVTDEQIGATDEQLQMMNDFVIAYSELCNLSVESTWKMLKSKYGFDNPEILSKKAADTVIKQLETWYSKKKGV